MKDKNPILTRLFPEEIVTIPESDGTKTIADSSDIFTSFIEPIFEKLGSNSKGKKTKKMPAWIHKLTRKASPFDMLKSLSKDFDKLCFTQNQIVLFCAKHLKFFKERKCATLFLFKEGDEYHICAVFVEDEGSAAYLYDFKFREEWDTKYAPNLLTPSLEKKAA